MALSFRTIGVYTAISISAVTLYTLLRLAIPHNILLILLFLASIFVYECLKIRYSLPPHTKGPTYYYPLAVLLLLAGEAAELLVLWHGPKGNARDQIIRRSLVHASLAWNLVAEAEWWRSTFVCSHLNLPTCQCEKKLANVRLQHPSRWFEKSAIPSSTPSQRLEVLGCGLLRSGRRRADPCYGDRDRYAAMRVLAILMPRPDVGLRVLLPSEVGWGHGGFSDLVHG